MTPARGLNTSSFYTTPWGTTAGHPINVSLIMHPVMTRSDVAVAAVPLRKTLMP